MYPDAEWGIVIDANSEECDIIFHTFHGNEVYRYLTGPRTNAIADWAGSGWIVLNGE